MRTAKEVVIYETNDGRYYAKITYEDGYLFTGNKKLEELPNYIINSHETQISSAEIKIHESVSEDNRLNILKVFKRE